MKTQAMKCSKVEVHWLNYWRRNGYRIGRNQPIPCTAKMPPRSRWLQRLVGFIIIVAALCLLAVCLGKAAAFFH